MSFDPHGKDRNRPLSIRSSDGLMWQEGPGRSRVPLIELSSNRPALMEWCNGFYGSKNPLRALQLVKLLTLITPPKFFTSLRG